MITNRCVFLFYAYDAFTFLLASRPNVEALTCPNAPMTDDHFRSPRCLTDIAVNTKLNPMPHLCPHPTRRQFGVAPARVRR